MKNPLTSGERAHLDLRLHLDEPCPSDLVKRLLEEMREEHELALAHAAGMAREERTALRQKLAASEDEAQILLDECRTLKVERDEARQNSALAAEALRAIRLVETELAEVTRERDVLRIQARAIGSQLLDVQQDCIAAVRERDALQAEVEQLRTDCRRARRADYQAIDRDLDIANAHASTLAAVERLTTERDEARAEVASLHEARIADLEERGMLPEYDFTGGKRGPVKP